MQLKTSLSSYLVTGQDILAYQPSVLVDDKGGSHGLTWRSFFRILEKD
jgi:hypothetical protein